MLLQSSLWQNSQDFDAEESPDIKTICVYCFQWFSSVEMMRDHIQTCHSNLDDKKVKLIFLLYAKVKIDGFCS